MLKLYSVLLSNMDSTVYLGFLARTVVTEMANQLIAPLAV